MSSRMKVALGSCLALILGCFAPIVSVPFLGNVNFYSDGHGDGVFVIGLAVISLFFILIRKYRYLLITGLLSLVIIVYDFSNIQNVIGGNQISRSMIQMGWGWIFLFGGAIFLAISGLTRGKRIAKS